jgi:hypothetical protein
MNVKRFFGRLAPALMLAIVSAAVAQQQQASADSMLWRFKSNHQYKVQVSFYSQNRSYEWPGNGQSYDLNDYDEHTMNLSCIRGEKICFGAWATGDATTYWGVGYNNSHQCEDCCYHCGDINIPRQVLNE